MKAGYVYIMANRKNGTIYIGVTSDLSGRVYAHREGLVPGFTKRYGCKLLVWFEAHDDLDGSILELHPCPLIQAIWIGFLVLGMCTNIGDEGPLSLIPERRDALASSPFAVAVGVTA